MCSTIINTENHTMTKEHSRHERGTKQTLLQSPARAAKDTDEKIDMHVERAPAKIESPTTPKRDHGERPPRCAMGCTITSIWEIDEAPEPLRVSMRKGKGKV